MSSATRGRGADDRDRAKRWYRRHGPLAESFPAQRAAALSQETAECWQCDRRAGKTTAVAINFHEDSQETDYTYVYLAKTKESAKGIVWREMQKFSRRFDLGWRFMVEDLSITTPSGSVLYVRGADSPDLMERLHGLIKLRGAWIDEAAFWRRDLSYLVDEVIMPALADVHGFVRLMSRPGDDPSGPFHDRVHGIVPGWSLRKWSWRDNPHVAPQMHEHIAKLRAKSPDIDKSASFRKNYCNEWVTSRESRVYAFDMRANDVPEFEHRSGITYVVGVDFGWHDPTAFAVVAFDPSTARMVVVDSYSQSEMLLDAVAERLRRYIEEFPGLRIVADPARTQFIGELRVRYGLPIIEAEKTSKRDWIGSLNSDFVNQVIGVYRAQEQPISRELLELHWHRMTTGRMVEQRNKTNDMCDALLYAYRTLFPLLRRDPEQAPDAREMLAATVRRDSVKAAIRAAKMADRRRQ